MIKSTKRASTGSPEMQKIPKGLHILKAVLGFAFIKK